MVKKNRQVVEVEFDRDPLEASLQAATGADNLVRVSEGKWRLESGSDTDLRPVIFTFAVANNLTVLSMSKAESNLEEVFRELTK